MKIKVERSGGFTGIALSNEIESKDIPSDMLAIAKRLLSENRKNRTKRKSALAGSADRFTYRISIDDGINHKIVGCTEDEIAGDLKSLIKFVEKKSGTEK